MKIINPKDFAFRFWHPRPSRREFINTMGVALAGVLISRYGLSNNLIGLHGILKGTRSNMVAATIADNYESTFIRQRVEHLFDSLGGISDVVQPGDKVGIKINLTGGSGWANDPMLNGVDIRECAWTHPEVIRAVGELLIDSGVNGNDIYIVEARWDDACYYQYGYSDVQDYLGAHVINLNVAAPYGDFIIKPTGSDYFFYDSFIMNGILNEIDVFVSIPKMKQHYTAGVTHSMKNLVGCTPLNYYQMPDQQGTRSKLHLEGGEAGFHLPRSICDLNMARPVHLAVIDGVKNAIGGEGPWNPTFEPHEDHFLLAGKNAVSTDSIASYIMGNDPEPAQLLRPDGTYCDNHLWLANQKGLGTNIISEIELVGDGAGSISGIDDENNNNSREYPIKLYQNYPNPFHSSTKIRYYVHDSGPMVSLFIYNHNGQEINRLVNEYISSGEHIVEWNAGNLPGGIYYARLSVNGFSQVRKMNLAR
jgi:uncharacterized protein (DUF362 family)